MGNVPARRMIHSQLEVAQTLAARRVVEVAETKLLLLLTILVKHGG